MFRLLAALVVFILIIGAAAYFFFFTSSPKVIKPTSENLSKSITSSSPKEVPADIPTEDKIKFLQEELDNLKKSTASEKTDLSSQSTSNLTTRLNTIETTLASLQATVQQLKSSSSTTTTTTTGKSPTYILPLGYGGSSTSQDYATISTLSFTIDPSKYPGHTSMQLQVNTYLKEGNGTAYIRLINTTDGTGVLSSEFTTNVQTLSWISSPNFNLPSGEKTYKVQVKSLTAYLVTLDNARILVNY